MQGLVDYLKEENGSMSEKIKNLTEKAHVMTEIFLTELNLPQELQVN